MLRTGIVSKYGGIIAGSAWHNAVLALSPSLYWPMDAAYGSTDQSGNGRNGTPQGGLSVGAYSDGPPITGETDTSTDFGGPGSGHRITSNYSGLFTNGTSRTLIGWGWRDDLAATHVVWGATGDADQMYLPGSTPDVKFDSYGGGTETETWAGAWAITSWVFWAFVFDEPSDETSLYINGSFVSTQAHTSQWFGSSGNFEVGGNGGTASFNGKQAHVAIFESKLTATNISNLWTAAS